MDWENTEEPQTEGSKTTAISEIVNGHQNVDFSRIVGDNKLVLVADHHTNYEVRRFLARSTSLIKNSGITHFAVEIDVSLQGEIDTFLQGKDNNARFPHTDDFLNLIREISKQGIKVVAVNHDLSSRSREDKESETAKNILKLTSVKENRVMVLFGIRHIVTGFNPEGVASVGKRLMDSKIPTTKLFFNGGDDSDSAARKIFGNTRFDKYVVQCGLDGQEFMLNLVGNRKIKTIPFDDEADWVIHLPRKNN